MAREMRIGIPGGESDHGSPDHPVRHHCDHYAGHRFDHLNQRKYGDEEVDVCIVGAGAAGGVLAQRLAGAGLRVVVVEAGPFWDPASDFASDELSMQRLGWQDTRLVGGGDPLQLGHNTCGRGVGGGTVHFTGVFLRFHESDFRTRSADGVGVDWPLSYHDLDFHYRQIEHEVAVSGPLRFPWGPYPGPYPYPARAATSPNAQVFERGCGALGIRSSVPPLAILSAPHEGRPPCINRGFCNQGCKPNAKFSTLIQHVPMAIAAGAEILSDCMVTQVEVGRDGLVTGVVFRHDGREHRQRARVVILASFVVETPRLLLQCTGPGHEDGLANSSGMVGRCIMIHASHDVYAAFEQEVRLYKGTPVLATTQDFYETDPQRGFVRGYTLHAHGARPVEFAGGLVKAGLWAASLRDAMREYNHLARITMIGEVLPDPGNRVSLVDETDANGMRRARVDFTYGENDRRLIEHAVGRAQAILSAAGGEPRHVVPDTAHLLGGCRMGEHPATSVVDRDCRCHDVPNLYICSGAVFPTSGGGNPTETIMAVASRTAARLLERARRRELATVGTSE
jgi:choline dehydrogenase-like flavoprotein